MCKSRYCISGFRFQLGQVVDIEAHWGPFELEIQDEDRDDLIQEAHWSPQELEFHWSPLEFNDVGDFK